MCTNYQMLVWTLSHRRSGASQPAQPHNHPSKTSLAAKLFNPKVERIAREAMNAENRLVNSNLWKDVTEPYKMKKEMELRRALDGLDDEALTDEDEEGNIEHHHHSERDLDEVPFNEHDLDSYVDEDNACMVELEQAIAMKRTLVHGQVRGNSSHDTASSNERGSNARKRAKV